MRLPKGRWPGLASSVASTWALNTSVASRCAPAPSELEQARRAQRRATGPAGPAHRGHGRAAGHRQCSWPRPRTTSTGPSGSSGGSEIRSLQQRVAQAEAAVRPGGPDCGPVAEIDEDRIRTATMILGAYDAGTDMQPLPRDRRAAELEAEIAALPDRYLREIWSRASESWCPRRTGSRIHGPPNTRRVGLPNQSSRPALRSRSQCR